MMTSTVTNDRMPSMAGRLGSDGLGIHEFDQWDNPADLDVTFSGVCWAEFVMEPTE